MFILFAKRKLNLSGLTKKIIDRIILNNYLKLNSIA